MNVSRARVLAIVALFICSIVPSSIGSPALAQEADGEPPELMPSDARSAPSVDGALAAQLTDGPAFAIVTTWTRAELSVLGRLGIAGAELRYLPMAFATITSAQLAALQQAPEVRSVWGRESFPVEMTESTYVVKAREAWASFGATGKDVEIAVIDTGIDGQHADADNLIEFCETTQSATELRSTVLCSPFNAAAGNAGPAGATGNARKDSQDDDGHGSHVSGTIAGTGDASGGRNSPLATVGIAPEAKLRVYSANAGTALLNHEILSAFDDLTWKRANGFNTVVAVSNSWGGGGGANYDRNDPIHVAVNEAYKVGILSVFAAGNSGPEHNTLSRQCVNPFVVCVAATTKNDQVAMFSSRGRPSQPSDTNRDGVINASDRPPDNHDRQLGQALSLGLYRPTVSAPGVAILSISANSPGCREGFGTNTECYEALNGTSMATPHVSGAVAVIAQAFRDARGRLPTATEVTRILERSANLNTLPGWEAEEQGAGRLNVLEAVRMAKGQGKRDRTKLVLGYPTPPQTTRTTQTLSGCTTALSWSTGIGYGQHTFVVPENAERLRMRVSWSTLGDNLYTQLWRPGVDPDARVAGPGRVFPDQEHANLLHMTNIVAGAGIPLTFRLMDVRAPEPGTWTLRVYSRVEDSPQPPCGGTPYTIAAELFTAGPQPSVTIASPANASLVSGAVTVSGSATYPAMWDGVRYDAVPGSEVRSAIAGTKLFMHGTAHDGMSGDGKADFAAGLRPFLSSAPVGTGTRGSWTTSPFLTSETGPTADDPDWRMALAGPTVLEGPARFSWWASCNACNLGADWIIGVFADGQLKFSRRLAAPLPAPAVPARLTVDLILPRIDASQEVVVFIDPVFIDAQTISTLYYDSSEQCEAVVIAPPPDAVEPSAACDSYAILPLVSAASAPPSAATGLRVTERVGSVLVEWNAAAGATGYEVHRSTDPAFVPSAKTRIASTAATAVTDAGRPNVTYYYRVVALSGAAQSKPSLLAYGASRRAEEPARLVRVRTDNAYGPRYWHFADITADGTGWTTTWDSAGAATGPHTIAARSYAQGVASIPATITITR